MEIIIITRRFVVGLVSQNGKERVIKRIKYTIDSNKIMCEHVVFGQRCYKCGKRVAKSHDLTKDYLMRMWAN